MRPFGLAFRAAAIKEAARVSPDDLSADHALIIDNLAVIGELLDHGITWEAMLPALSALDAWHSARVEHGTLSVLARQKEEEFEDAICSLKLHPSTSSAREARRLRRERKNNVG